MCLCVCVCMCELAYARALHACAFMRLLCGKTEHNTKHARTNKIRTYSTIQKPSVGPKIVEIKPNECVASGVPHTVDVHPHRTNLMPRASVVLGLLHDRVAIPCLPKQSRCRIWALPRTRRGKMFSQQLVRRPDWHLHRNSSGSDLVKHRDVYVQKLGRPKNHESYWSPHTY